MSIIDTLIFDRNSTDLSNDTDRCYIAYTDLNRIEQACEYLADINDMYVDMISGIPRLSFTLGKRVLGNRR